MKACIACKCGFVIVTPNCVTALFDKSDKMRRISPRSNVLAGKTRSKRLERCADSEQTPKILLVRARHDHPTLRNMLDEPASFENLQSVANGLTRNAEITRKITFDKMVAALKLTCHNANFNLIRNRGTQ